MPHLLVAISPHGFGHLSQVAPVIRRLREDLPSLQLTLRTTLPERLLKQRIGGEFALQRTADDFGMVQRSALEVDLPQSLRRYRRLHARWPQEVERVARELEQAAPDLILADVPYLTLAAAQKAAIPAVAMCSLNWYAILQGYLSQDAIGEEWLAQIRQAYASAECFFRPEPSMPMPGLDNLQDIGVVAGVGRHRRIGPHDDAAVRLNDKLVLVAMGGIAHRLPMEHWPRLPSCRFIVPAAWEVSRDDCITIESCNMDFSDLLASVDVVVTKPGYGTFTEAALNAVPVLYVRRGDWPEEPCLIEWLQTKANCLEVTRQALEMGRIESELFSLFAMKRRPPVRAEGVEQAAAEIISRLSA